MDGRDVEIMLDRPERVADGELKPSRGGWHRDIFSIEHLVEDRRQEERVAHDWPIRFPSAPPRFLASVFLVVIRRISIAPCPFAGLPFATGGVDHEGQQWRVDDGRVVVVIERPALIVAQDESEGDVAVVATLLKVLPPALLVVFARILEGVVAHIYQGLDLQIQQIVATQRRVDEDVRPVVHLDRDRGQACVQYAAALLGVRLMPRAGVEDHGHARLRVAREDGFDLEELRLVEGVQHAELPLLEAERMEQHVEARVVLIGVVHIHAVCGAGRVLDCARLDGGLHKVIAHVGGIGQLAVVVRLVHTQRRVREAPAHPSWLEALRESMKVVEVDAPVLLHHLQAEGAQDALQHLTQGHRLAVFVEEVVLRDVDAVQQRRPG